MVKCKNYSLVQWLSTGVPRKISDISDYAAENTNL